MHVRLAAGSVAAAVDAEAAAVQWMSRVADIDLIYVGVWICDICWWRVEVFTPTASARPYGFGLSSYIGTKPVGGASVC